MKNQYNLFLLSFITLRKLDEPVMMQFSLSSRVTPTRTGPVNNEMKQQCYGAVRMCPCVFERFPSCGIFAPTRTSSVKQRVETTG